MYYWIKRRNEETKEKDRKGKNNESKESRKGVSERNPVEWWDRECMKAIKLRKKV